MPINSQLVRYYELQNVGGDSLHPTFLLMKCRNESDLGLIFTHLAICLTTVVKTQQRR